MTVFEFVVSRRVFMIPSPSCSLFSSDLSQSDVRVTRLSSSLWWKHTRAKALCCCCYCGPGQGGEIFVFWAFCVSCGGVSSSAHPIIQPSSPSLLSFTFFLSPPSFNGCDVDASPPLVSLSVTLVVGVLRAAFNSVSPPPPCPAAVEPQNKRV